VRIARIAILSSCHGLILYVLLNILHMAIWLWYMADFLWTHCRWTLQNAPRDECKLRELLRIKQGQKEQAMHIEDTQRG
jgi:hypothetical protein